MKKMRKIVALVLALALCLSLAACSGGDKGGSGNKGGGSVDGASKEEIVIGYVGPFTGALSMFTADFDWLSKQAVEAINADGGIYIESYDKTLPVRVVIADSESNPTTASEVAQKLVLEQGVDVLCGGWTPDTTAPVSAVAEKNGIPCLLSNSPAESWQASGNYEWSYGIMFSVEDMMASYADALDKLDTNKKVGFLFDSEVDGVTFSAALEKELKARGYEIVDPGRFPMSTTDYTSIITQFKDAGCDIVAGNQILPNFTTAWQQFHQLGYVPKAMIIGKAIAYGSDVAALGNDIGNGLLTEIHWDRSYPYTSTLLGLTAEELAQKWESEFNSQYTGTSMGYNLALFEVLDIALSNCKDLEPATIRQAISEVSYDGIYGHLDAQGTHVFKVPLVTGQWVQSDTWDYEAVIVGNGNYPEVETVDPIIIPGTTLK